MVDVMHILPFCDNAGTLVTVSVGFFKAASDSDHSFICLAAGYNKTVLVTQRLLNCFGP
jgi:hypothetical protein